MKTLHPLAVAGAFGLLLSWTASLAGPLTGGSFGLIGAAGGGGISTGGGYVLSGWVASAGAGTSSGEEFDLTCELIGVYVVTGGDATLKVELTGDGLVRIWWSPDLVGYQLESSASVGSSVIWAPVNPPPAGSSHFVEPVGPGRFYRLRSP